MIINYIKFIQEWCKLKTALWKKQNKVVFKQGDIWWCSLGINLGEEMFGKGTKFTRPVLIFRKYDRFSFFAIPLTTKNKVGTWYCSFTHSGKPQTAQLAQGRVVSYKRIKELIGKIDSVDFDKVKEAFIALHKK